jgi:hypothetical protein
MTRDITTAPVPTTTPALRSNWRFGARIAVIIVATLLLLTWTAGQLRTTDDTVNAVPAPVHQSIRQVDHAEQGRAQLGRLEDTDVRRFANQASALTPVQSNPNLKEQAVLRQLNDAESAPLHRRPGVQP